MVIVLVQSLVSCREAIRRAIGMYQLGTRRVSWQCRWYSVFIFSHDRPSQELQPHSGVQYGTTTIKNEIIKEIQSISLPVLRKAGVKNEGNTQSNLACTSTPLYDPYVELFHGIRHIFQQHHIFEIHVNLKEKLGKQSSWAITVLVKNCFAQRPSDQ